MIAIDDQTTIGGAFRRAVDAYSSNAFLAVPANSARSYHKDGFEVDFATAGCEVERLIAIYGGRGIGHGHRVAMLLENRPEHFLHKLALNTLGASCVPINPDYRPSEIAYLLSHSKADLALVVDDRREHLRAGVAECARQGAGCVRGTPGDRTRLPGGAPKGWARHG